MRTIRVAAAILAAGMAAPAAAQEAVSLPAADGVVVHGQVYGAGAPRGVIVAFHQAGSNKAEYAPIAPRLVRDGFEVIAIDQRSGGGMFGGTNLTAEGRGGTTGEGRGGYLAAMPDLEGALNWAEAHAGGRPVLAFGSSYSASLVILLAASHPGLAAIAVFSPGEYLPGVSVRLAAEKVTCPFFATSAADPQEIEAANALISASPARVKEDFVPQVGVHGAKTLRTDADPGGEAAEWRALEAFLNRAVPAGRPEK